MYGTWLCDDMSKPREWWIKSLDLNVAHGCTASASISLGRYKVSDRQQVNVIEKSAYDELKVQAEKLAEALKFYSEMRYKAHSALAEYSLKSKGEE